MRVLNSQELKLKQELKRQGIIKLVDPMQAEPNVLMYCGDCHRAPNAVSYEQAIQQEAGFDPVIHHIAVNGGPLNLVHDHCGIYPDFLDDRTKELVAGLKMLIQPDPTKDLLNGIVRSFLMAQIRGSHLLKRLRRLKLKGHWPCGQGEEGWHLDLETALHELALATEFVRETLPRYPETENVKVVAGLHLHKPEEMSTYHFCTRKWLESRRAVQLA